MFAITSIGFPLFALLLVPLWYRTAPARRWCVMLAASGVFYLSIDPPGLPLLAAATAVVWLAAKRLNTEPAGRAKPRFWLAVGLAAALGPLLALKYSGAVYAPFRGLWQPLGLAYFSLQLISYLVDVYRGQIGPADAPTGCPDCIRAGPLLQRGTADGMGLLQKAGGSGPRIGGGGGGFCRAG